MYILDTDHMTVLERGGPSSAVLVSRLRKVPLFEVATTIVVYEEQTRGWLAKTAREKGLSLVRAYGYLRLDSVPHRSHLRIVLVLPEQLL